MRGDDIMSILKCADGNEMMITCSCGCDEGIHFRFDREDDGELYCCMAFISGRFYQEQEHAFRKKIKKIWAIIRNKDYYYSDVCMNKTQYQELKEYINGF